VDRARRPRDFAAGAAGGAELGGLASLFLQPGSGRWGGLSAGVINREDGAGDGQKQAKEDESGEDAARGASSQDTHDCAAAQKACGRLKDADPSHAFTQPGFLIFT